MSNIKLIGGMIITALIGVVFLMTYFTVEPNEIAVVTHFGKIGYDAGPGLHFKMPFTTSYRTFRTDIQDVSADHAINTYTVDNQEVDVRFNIFYRIPAAGVDFIYQNVPDYQTRLLTIAVDRIKAQMGKVNVSSVAESRGTLRDAIKGVLSNDAKSLGLEVTDFQLTDMQYTDSYRTAIAAAASAKAGVEAKIYQQQQAQKDAETAAIQAEGQANAQRAKAKGEADATLYQAQAEAKSIELKGQATAQAIEAQAVALAKNPNLVDLHKADAWDGKLPVNMYASAPLPFFNVNSAGK